MKRQFSRWFVFCVLVAGTFSHVSPSKAADDLTVPASLPPGSEIVSFQLFESGFDPDPIGEREYRSDFRESSRYIHWELKLVHPAPPRRYPFSVGTIIYKDGEPYAMYGSEYAVEAGWTNSYFSDAWGNIDGNTWKSGSYRIEIHIDGAMAGTDGFVVEPPK